MKKNLLSILTVISIFSSTAIAQPTLTSTNTNPVIGDLLTLQSYNYVNQGSSGANQTWNFSSIIQTTNAAVTNTYATLSSGDAALFPNATIQNISTPTASMFYKAGPQALQVYGLRQGTVNISYSNPEDHVQYPFTMGTSFSDPFTATFSSAGSTYTRTGTSSLNGDAYGTIQLPGGTFSNVLRTHFIENYKDSTYIAGFGNYVIKYLNDMYLWYLPNNHTSIFSTYSITVTQPFGNPTTVTGANKLTSILSGINELTNYISSLNFYPNPSTNGILNLDLNLNENIKYEVAILDNLGREVLRTSSENGFEGYNFKTIDVSNLASGFYNFEIISNKVPLINKKVIINN